MHSSNEEDQIHDEEERVERVRKRERAHDLYALVYFIIIITKEKAYTYIVAMVSYMG